VFFSLEIHNPDFPLMTTTSVANRNAPIAVATATAAEFLE
jgi:hypothetical protein